MSTVDALRLVAALSKKYANDATKALRINNEATRQLMFNNIAQMVLADNEIELSTEDRRLISSSITEDDEGGRDYSMRVRLTVRERYMIEKTADEFEMTVSDFVRKVLMAVTDEDWRGGFEEFSERLNSGR